MACAPIHSVPFNAWGGIVAFGFAAVGVILFCVTWEILFRDGMRVIREERARIQRVKRDRAIWNAILYPKRESNGSSPLNPSGKGVGIP